MEPTTDIENIIIKLEPVDYLEEESDEPNTISNQTSVHEFQEDTITSAEEHTDESQETSQDSTNDPLQAFCFENDHPALKYNSDYKQLIKAIAVLEAQRSKAIKDLDRLYELQEEALEDPIAFVERLQRKENIDIPGPQKIYPIPTIDWNKYSLTANNTSLGRRQLTRLSSKATQDLLRTNSKGKYARDTKPNKVNQYWTAEEQKQLEDLLIQFPPEEVESRRWEKIANCLENRTAIQVASRVQKYFIKLMKAGIPIPGRMPNLHYLRKAKRSVIRQQPSTFLVSHRLPVYMPEEEYEYNFCPVQNTDENSTEMKAENSDDEDFDADLKETAEFKELTVLKKLQKEKLQVSSVQHIGFKCTRCKIDPIIGVRWHCTDCKPPMTIDFCADCIESPYEIGQHSSEHQLESIHQAAPGLIERDYMHFLSSDYNYLDPNYMPAS